MKDSQVKERPMLFSAPMVRALLSGTKTQTRRKMKCPKGREDIWQDGQGHFDIQPCYNKPGYEMWDWEYDSCRTTPLVCPYGKPGDRLWVKETYCKLGGELIYRADYDNFSPLSDGIGGPWKSSMFMPRAASRLLLGVVSVRVERLLSISAADAVAEGIEEVLCPTHGAVPARKWKNYLGRAYQDGANLNYPVESYFSLWNSINGADAHLDNPWVWVVEFKRIEA